MIAKLKQWFSSSDEIHELHVRVVIVMPDGYKSTVFRAYWNIKEMNSEIQWLKELYNTHKVFGVIEHVEYK